MSAPPKISIGVPVYNGERYLTTALENLLAQDLADFEIVISDNNSRDRSADIGQEYARRDPRIRYIRYHDTVGPVDNFLRALSQARGEYFTWTAVDDARPPDALAACARALDDHPSAVMAHGPVRSDFIRTGEQVLIDNRMDLTSAIPADRVATYTREVRHNGILYGLYRRAALLRTTFRQHPGHDYLMGMQMCLLGPVMYVPATMLVYQHVWGEADIPMYRLHTPTLRDLLIYRGVRRHKCWITLLRGVQLIWTMPGVPRGTRLHAVLAHVRAFARRYPRHMAAEVVFLACTPLARLCYPLAPLGRRLKRRWTSVRTV